MVRRFSLSTAKIGLDFEQKQEDSFGQLIEKDTSASISNLDNSQWSYGSGLAPDIAQVNQAGFQRINLSPREYKEIDLKNFKVVRNGQDHFISFSTLKILEIANNGSYPSGAYQVGLSGIEGSGVDFMPFSMIQESGSAVWASPYGFNVQDSGSRFSIYSLENTSGITLDVICAGLI